MSVIGSNILAGASGQAGYNLTNSLRFRSSASAYLNRTPSSSPTDSKKYTYSTWIKKSKVATANQFIYGCGSSGSDETYFGFNSSDKFEYLEYTSGAYQVNVSTTAVYRDPSAWYHLLLVFDTTQATSSDRVKLYINGVQQTLSGTFPSLNYASSNVNSTDVQNINRLPTSGGLNFDGYYAETIMVDGQALTPSSFGETSSTTGVWQPKKYAGTYGTNGFYLPFTDNSALTSGSNAGLGKDFSGNGNYWTTNNISITSGSTYDSMTDVPTLTSATASNFCTWNPLQKGTGAAITFSNGNLLVTEATSSGGNGAASMAVSSGKYYFESVVGGLNGGSHMIGILPVTQALGSAAGVIRSNNNGWYNFSSVNTGGTTFSSNGDVVGVAFDVDAGKCWFSVNGSWVGSGNPSVGTNPAFTFTANTEVRPWFLFDNQVNTKTFDTTFGQRPFAYTPPTGFVALNTYNLPTPTIGATASSQANKYFDATLYTGNVTNRTITNAAGFPAEFVWIKDRSAARQNSLSDIVRGVNKEMFSDSTDADTSPETQVVTAFGPNGFSIGPNGVVNASGENFVAWQWRANGTGVTNTAGSITSTVSANTTSGFSVVTWAGTNSASTIGHGLGVAPKMIIVKNRSTTGSWNSYHASLGNASVIYLNLTNAAASGVGTWNSTSPTSTVFSVTGNDTGVNQSGSNYVAYCFAEVAGFSKAFSYTGNGSSDGVYVNLGFKPRWIIIKRTDAAQSWWIHDTARDTYNTTYKDLFANLSNAEETGNGNYIDFLSNGIKMRNANNGFNASGGSYIGFAVAEVPTKYALGV